MRFNKVAICNIFAHLPIYLWAADVFVVPTCDVEIGDVVFRRGQGPWTRYFIDCSSREKRFSHVGIVVSNVNEVIIAHAEANDWTGVGQVHLQPWDGFFTGSLEQAVFRYQGNKTARRRVASEAEKMLGVPFDRLFDMGDTNRLYCTEFVRLAVNRAVGYELIGFTTVCGRPVIAIDDIYRSKFIRVYDSKWAVTNRNSVVAKTKLISQVVDKSRMTKVKGNPVLGWLKIRRLSLSSVRARIAYFITRTLACRFAGNETA